MAHFAGDVEGGRTSRSTVGTKTSGMKASLNGWNLGVDVTINHQGGKDVVKVYKTSGTVGDKKRELVTEYSE